MADIRLTHSTIERCRELLGDEAVGLSEEDIATIRDHADAMAHLIVGIFLEQQSRRNQKDDDICPIRWAWFDPGLVPSERSFGINDLQKPLSGAIEPRNILALNHL